ncbi:MAG: hypothetical protein JWL77_3509, partial [Chthonomonadaceae bacterium]|nr:hypothetical protein [Chthonomonadaceae bacterium]
MAVTDTFSKRMARQERAGQEDVYQYGVLPQKFKNQVSHIWNSAIGAKEGRLSVSTHSTSGRRYSNDVWKKFYD